MGCLYYFENLDRVMLAKMKNYFYPAFFKLLRSVFLNRRELNYFWEFKIFTIYSINKVSIINYFQ